MLDDLTGHTFGRLTVLKLSHRHNGAIYWLCRCDCGAEHTTRAQRLRSGKTTSCPGCGYRHDSERHVIARDQVPPDTRKRIAEAGAAARKASL